eukprot:TRINITY_DN10581_c0_g1_i1.p1 TRINITY_DN10581_c0_g1~~TRINITY_DN10581_c0_g1_i1.p1  ORF type:complete len:73 (-),score=2.73 TRINITY_DN10581_c0_g1_i1:66-284(-)
MPPFQIIYQVGTLKIRPTIPSNCPQELAALIELCWTENADERPTFIALTEMINSMDPMSPHFSNFMPVKATT